MKIKHLIEIFQMFDQEKTVVIMHGFSNVITKISCIKEEQDSDKLIIETGDEIEDD